MKRLPIVAIIGQTNAGKSSLLNRFARKNIAIVAREQGTTRDNVIARIDDRFLLIDTAGLKPPEDDFETNIQDQIADAVASADLILLALDSTKYPDYNDKNIAKMAFKSQKPFFLLLNKSDCGDALPDSEFLSLGVKPPETFRVSATTGQGINALKSAILSSLNLSSPLSFGPNNSPSDSSNPPSKSSSSSNDFQKSSNIESAHPKAPLKITLIGRPNVGKSSLFNSLGKKQQALVSSKQGTTRDINRIQIKFKGRELEILDTAGLRKPGKREVGIEKFSALRTLSAIEESDICALLVDSTEPHSKLDQSLAGQIIEAGKGIVVVVTKSDLLERSDQSSQSDRSSQSAQSDNSSLIDHILDNLERDFNFLPFAPVLITSSKTGKNITKLFDLALDIDEARHVEIKTSELNKILNDAIISHPPAGLKNTHPKPKYIVQTDTCPPWFVIHGREMELLHWSYKRFLERKIREHYPFLGTPIRFSFHNDKK